MPDSIPEFPQFCEVTLDLAEEVQPALRELRPAISELTFSNLFVFRRAHAYRLSRRQGFLVVTATGYDGRPYAFPPLGGGDVEEAARLLCAYLSSQGSEPVLFPVPKELAEAYFSHTAWRIEADRDQADYVYCREELATLTGAKFHKRKNRLLKFLREEAGGYEYDVLRDEHREECLALAQGWCEIRCSAQRPSTYLETEAVADALRNRKRLELRGGVIVLAGRVRAFCLGEELNPETFVVHFEKTEQGREGLAQLINWEFCRTSLGEYRFVNREQDLGDPGLRRAKEAYHPAFFAEKYRVSPR